MTSRRRARACRICREKFYPDCRQKGRQYACARAPCQSDRSVRNNRRWYLENPDCLAHQRSLTREWHASHPGYQTAYRLKNPETVTQNRRDTAQRMTRIRRKKLFEKTNSSFSQLVDSKWDKCFLNARSGWLHLRLKKQTRYTEYARSCEDLARIHPRKVRPFGGRIYNVGHVLTQKNRPPP